MKKNLPKQNWKSRLNKLRLAITKGQGRSLRTDGLVPWKVVCDEIGCSNCQRRVWHQGVGQPHEIARGKIEAAEAKWSVVK